MTTALNLWTQERTYMHVRLHTHTPPHTLLLTHIMSVSHRVWVTDTGKLFSGMERADSLIHGHLSSTPPLLLFSHHLVLRPSLCHTPLFPRALSLRSPSCPSLINRSITELDINNLFRLKFAIISSGSTAVWHSTSRRGCSKAFYPYRVLHIANSPK